MDTDNPYIIIIDVLQYTTDFVSFITYSSVYLDIKYFRKH